VRPIEPIKQEGNRKGSHRPKRNCGDLISCHGLKRPSHGMGSYAHRKTKDAGEDFLLADATMTRVL
jgi:hypothetical protein